jgi:hypothetical protein
MHGVSPESRFVPEVDFAPALPRSRSDCRVGFSLPALDRLRVTLVGALQGFLRRQPELGQHAPMAVTPIFTPNFCSISAMTMARIHSPKSSPYRRGSRPLIQ